MCSLTDAEVLDQVQRSGGLLGGPVGYRTGCGQEGSSNWMRAGREFELDAGREGV